MRTPVPSKSAAGSSLLLVVLMIGMITVISLGTYLSLATNQSRSVLRSQAWNAALPLAEAGMEEGLTHAVAGGSLGSDGWTLSGSAYTKQRTLIDGYYLVTITSSSGQVTISSTGYALVQGSTYITRTIQVTAQNSTSIFPSLGLSAPTISFGGDFKADSYDSSNPLYSTAGNVGAYDSTKKTANAVVALAAPGTSYSMGGNSSILGYAAAPPWGTIDVSGSAAISDGSLKKGVQAGHTSYTFTNTVPDVVVPSYLNSATAPGSGSVSGTSYNYVLNGNYKAASLDSGGSSTTIYVQGNSKLYVSGNVTISQIVFAPGATLDLYIATPSLTLSPTIQGALPPQFLVWATSSCTSMTLNGNTPFVGFIYGSQLSLNANGNAAIYGGITAKSFSCNGTFDIHYDCSRTNGSSASAFKVLFWAEL